MIVLVRYDLRLSDRSSPAAIAGVARWAEEMALATLWASEAGHDPFLPLALAAADTRQLPLGTGIAIAFARSPFATAQAAWDLQRLSEGRFLLGLGSQVRAHIERRYGQPWHGAVPQMREYVECLRHIWACWQTGERPSYRGRIYRFDLTNPEFEPPRLPDAEARIPIWLGAVGPAMTSLAGEIADGLHVHAFHTEGYLRARVLPAVAEGRRRSGQPVAPLPATCPVLAACAHDERQRDTMRRTFRAHIAFYASTPAYVPVLEDAGCAELHPRARALSRESRWEEMADIVPDDVLDDFVVIDEPRALGARLRAKYEGILTQLALYRGGDRFMREEDWPVFLDALGHGAPLWGPAD